MIYHDLSSFGFRLDHQNSHGMTGFWFTVLLEILQAWRSNKKLSQRDTAERVRISAFVGNGDSETNDICRKHIYISKRIMCVIYYIVNKDKHKLIILFYLLLLWQNCNFVGVDAFWILSGADSGAPWPPAPRLLGCLWAVGLRWSP